MNFYERIKKKNIRIPESFDMNVMQMFDLQKKATEDFDIISIAFKFGYMQGVRAERLGKAGILNGK